VILGRIKHSKTTQPNPILSHFLAERAKKKMGTNISLVEPNAEPSERQLFWKVCEDCGAETDAKADQDDIADKCAECGSDHFGDLEWGWE
jgi:hypothetical protein